jgi:hypothetical protein
LNKDRITAGSFNEEDTLNGMAFDTLDTFLELTQLFLKPRTLARIKQSAVSVGKKWAVAISFAASGYKATGNFGCI